MYVEKMIHKSQKHVCKRFNSKIIILGRYLLEVIFSVKYFKILPQINYKFIPDFTTQYNVIIPVLILILMWRKI